jgi:hypothetical protein
MLIHASLETGYKVKSRVAKSEATILNLRYAKQQPSRVQGYQMELHVDKLANKCNSMREKMATKYKN